MKLEKFKATLAYQTLKEKILQVVFNVESEDRMSLLPTEKTDTNVKTYVADCFKDYETTEPIDTLMDRAISELIAEKKIVGKE